MKSANFVRVERPWMLWLNSSVRARPPYSAEKRPSLKDDLKWNCSGSDKIPGKASLASSSIFGIDNAPTHSQLESDGVSIVILPKNIRLKQPFDHGLIRWFNHLYWTENASRHAVDHEATRANVLFQSKID